MDDDTSAVDSDGGEGFQQTSQIPAIPFSKGVLQEGFGVLPGNVLELTGGNLDCLESGIPDAIHCELDRLSFGPTPRVHHQ